MVTLPDPSFFSILFLYLRHCDAFVTNFTAGELRAFDYICGDEDMSTLDEVQLNLELEKIEFLKAQHRFKVALFNAEKKNQYQETIATHGSDEYFPGMVPLGNIG
ncbi:hypothetical protein EVAR_43828_1 [Eumeta japonica]|uniref:Uncharacterized protein n=1 Tax=Eumeta variegata TaxID=151549 RepID=A0A4C1WX05_EUMVA|nr:hypothetical protein EVAR_43828_1 [Eumeta japonica]